MVPFVDQAVDVTAFFHHADWDTIYQLSDSVVYVPSRTIRTKTPERLSSSESVTTLLRAVGTIRGRGIATDLMYTARSKGFPVRANLDRRTWLVTLMRSSTTGSNCRTCPNEYLCSYQRSSYANDKRGAPLDRLFSIWKRVHDRLEFGAEAASRLPFQGCRKEFFRNDDGRPRGVERGY